MCQMGRSSAFLILCIIQQRKLGANESENQSPIEFPTWRKIGLEITDLDIEDGPIQVSGSTAKARSKLIWSSKSKSKVQAYMDNETGVGTENGDGDSGDDRVKDTVVNREERTLPDDDFVIEKKEVGEDEDEEDVNKD